MIISLIGFMGCGKSSVGRRLSELLCCRFMDLDDVVEEVAGRSIPEIFATDGELAFRQKELEALKTIVGGWMSKTKSLPRLRRGSLPFTGPRAATFFDTPTTDNESCSTELRKCQFLPNASPNYETHGSDRTSESTYEGGTAAVLALGGGTVMTPECAEIVKDNTVCIYLRASIDTLVEHLSSEAAERPLLAATDKSLHSRIEELMSQRASTYEKTANIIVDTDGKSIEQICSEITNLI